MFFFGKLSKNFTHFSMEFCFIIKSSSCILDSNLLLYWWFAVYFLAVCGFSFSFFLKKYFFFIHDRAHAHTHENWGRAPPQNLGMPQSPANLPVLQILSVQACAQWGWGLQPWMSCEIWLPLGVLPLHLGAGLFSFSYKVSLEEQEVFIGGIPVFPVPPIHPRFMLFAS